MILKNVYSTGQKVIILAKNYIWGANREFFPKLIIFVFLWHITPNSSKLAGALRNPNLHPQK